MRKFQSIIVLLLTSSALAVKPVTTNQLERFLATTHGKLDARVAQQIAALRLSERLSSWRLPEMLKQLPGDRSRQALLALADESAFLIAPQSELLKKATPDLAEQRRIMGSVVAYVNKAIPQLPNFLATRQITRFEDTPQRNNGVSTYNYEPLHWVLDLEN